MNDPSSLRVIDAGVVTPLRSQTVWHALGYGVSASGQPTLAFAQPSAGYACLGYHRRLGELDLDYCAGAGLPVLRRMVGGGPVYCDDGQLFFQIILPVGRVPANRLEALGALLAPAVAAYRACGVDAQLRDGEICVGDRKICGHGAGQIAQAVVVCGNLIGRFDHSRATRILRLPDAATRAEVERLMRRYVAPTPVEPERFRRALVEAYAAALRLEPRPGELSGAELEARDELDARFLSESWLAGPVPDRARPVQVKIREGVQVAYARQDSASVLVSSVRGEVVHAEVTAGRFTHVSSARQLVGRPLTELPRALSAALPGQPGLDRLAAELAA